jgi:hypothetical protein
VPDPERELIARDLLMTRKGWYWAKDGVVPSDARQYVVFDGSECVGSGWRPGTEARMVAQCEMPIVLWRL